MPRVTWVLRGPYMFPKSQGGADLQSMSYSAANFAGTLAPRVLVGLLNEQKLPKRVCAKFRLITNHAEPGVPAIPLKVCNARTPQELAGDCNVFASNLNVTSGFFDGAWSPEAGLGLHAAQSGSLTAQGVASAERALKGPVTSWRPGLGS